MGLRRPGPPQVHRLHHRRAARWSPSSAAPRGCGSPLHVHHNEDEWFYVIEGELTFWVGGEVIEAPAGSFVYGPRDVPHTFVVSSDDARFLLVTEPGGFEDFMRAMGRPAESLTMPPPEPPRPT